MNATEVTNMYGGRCHKKLGIYFSIKVGKKWTQAEDKM